MRIEIVIKQNNFTITIYILFTFNFFKGRRNLVYSLTFVKQKYYYVLFQERKLKASQY